MKATVYEVQLKIARRYVHEYRDTKAHAAALDLVRAMLTYRATTPLHSDILLEGALGYLRTHHADPAEIVARVVGFLLFIEYRPWHFKGQRAEDVGLGRLVLHSVPVEGARRYSAAVYGPAGVMAREHLGMFAGALLRKVKDDAARVAAMQQQSAVLE